MSRSVKYVRDPDVNVPAYGAVGSYTVNHDEDAKQYQATCDRCGTFGPVTLGYQGTDEWLWRHRCKGGTDCVKQPVS
jgi:Pyruvate/2-oxoacid:ferredoxin oxidoreductase delta subunit